MKTLIRTLCLSPLVVLALVTGCGGSGDAPGAPGSGADGGTETAEGGLTDASTRGGVGPDAGGDAGNGGTSDAGALADGGSDGGPVYTGPAASPVPSPLRGGGNAVCVDDETGPCGEIRYVVESSGKLATWGLGVDASGALTPGHLPALVGTDSDWVQVASYGTDACMLKTDGTRYCVGQPVDVGSTATLSPTTPTLADSLRWNTLAMGDGYGCGITADARLLCWASHKSEPAVFGNKVGTPGTPLELVPGKAWRAVTLANAATFALDADGSMWAWGAVSSSSEIDPLQLNEDVWLDVQAWGSLEPYGPLGAVTAVRADGTLWQFSASTATHELSKVQVGTSTAWARVAVGGSVICGIQKDASLWCYGFDEYGAAGVPWTPQTTAIAAPVVIAAGSSFRDVAVYAHGLCAMHLDGSVVCWGADVHGELGDGSRAAAWSSATWQPLHEEYTFVDLAAPSAALTADGRVVQWGALGGYSLGQDASVVPRPAPAVTLTGIASFGSRSASCALDASGNASCLEYTDVAPGTGDSYDRAYEAHSGGAAWSQLSAGASHLCGILTSGALACWGEEASGELGDGKMMGSSATAVVIGTGTWISVAAGSDESCAVATDGSMWCWGYNERGELGDGTTQNRDVPTRIGTANDWLDVRFGAGVWARKTDHSLWFWGGENPVTQSPTRFGAKTYADASYPYLLGDDGSVTSYASSVVGVALPPVVGATKIAAGWSTEAVCVLGATGTVLCQGLNITGDLGDPYAWSDTALTVPLP